MAKEPQATVIAFPKQRKRAEKARKSGLNHNKEGSVRNVNRTVYVDFMYLDERVRESSGLPWNENNAKAVREQLDRIVVAIKDGTFRFAEVFPENKNADYFDQKEKDRFRLPTTPDQVIFKSEALLWLDLKRGMSMVTGRTLKEYKSYLNMYLIPFFGEMTFAELNAHVFNTFISWAKRRRLRTKSVCQESIKRYFVPMRQICTETAIKYGWNTTFNPFFGFKIGQNVDRDFDADEEEILPFSIQEIRSIRDQLPEHWIPYFDFGFAAGLRPGEQIALKPRDIDWENGTLRVRRAITLDEDGHVIEGRPKNRHGRRDIQLTPAMLEALKAQRLINKTLTSGYFFCTPNGCRVELNNLLNRVWRPALERAKVVFRGTKHMRHTFATISLSSGEDPLWIAKVMGHCNTEMIHRRYARYVKNVKGGQDGAKLSELLCSGRQG